MRHTKTATLAFISILLAACTFNSRKTVMVGAYDDARKLTAQEDSLFRTVVLEREGLQLKPLKVARQVVGGMNYRFECIDAHKKKVEVVVYQPLPCHGEESRITSINDKPYTK